MKLLSLLFAVFMVVSAKSQIITTFAGGGSSFLDGVPATLSVIHNPSGGDFDKYGNFYVASQLSGPRVRKVNSLGIITTVAGTGVAGYNGDGIPATIAQLDRPNAVALDTSGNVFICDCVNHRIRKVDVSTGIISTVAGNGIATYAGDGGQATAASINGPNDICFDKLGNLYIAEYYSSRVRKVTPAGIISTFAGNGTIGYSGDGTFADTGRIGGISGLCSDTSGNIYLADVYNSRIFKVNTSGIITTVAGTSTGYLFSGDGIPATSSNIDPGRIGFDNSGNLYIAEVYNYRVRKVDLSGIISTVAGNGTAGFSGDGTLATAASLNYAGDIAFDSCGNLYFPETGTARVRKVVLAPLGSSTLVITPTPNDTVCAGTSVVYSTSVSSGTIIGYQWYVNGTAIAGATNDTYVYAPADLDSVRCVTIVSASCNYTSVSSNTIDMVVNPVIVPTVNVTPLPNDTVCAGTMVTYSSSVTAGGMADSYQWYVNGVPVGTVSSYSYVPANGDSIRCAYTSTSTCGGTVTVNSNMTHMVVNPLMMPTVSITVAPDDTVCTGIAVNFSAAVSGGSAVSYSWYKNGSVVSAAGSTYSYVPSNGDSVRCEVASSEGCTGSPIMISSNTIDMVVPATVMPTIAITGMSAVAVGGTVTVNATVSGATAYTIKWMNKGIVFSTTTVPVVTYTKASGTDSITARVVPTGEVCYDSAASNLHVVAVEKTGVYGTALRSIKVYPNPASGQLVIEDASGYTLKIIDVVGKEVYSGVVSDAKHVADIGYLSGGVYIVQPCNDAGERRMVRVVKE